MAWQVKSDAEARRQEISSETNTFQIKLAFLQLTNAAALLPPFMTFICETMLDTDRSLSGCRVE